jgi:hypothetical protein
MYRSKRVWFSPPKHAVPCSSTKIWHAYGTTTRRVYAAQPRTSLAAPIPVGGGA